jgi:epoxyqueuosine reductase
MHDRSGPKSGRVTTMPPLLMAIQLERAARSVGFHGATLVDPGCLPGPGARLALRCPDGMEPDWVLRPDIWRDSSSILICALSCRRDEPDDLSTADDPHALIAPFARRGHYAAAAAMVGELVREVGQIAGFPPRRARIFVNSRIPEKQLLVASGLGWYGKNGLIIIPGLGSLFVIAGCVLPLPVELSSRASRDPPAVAPDSALTQAPQSDFPLCGDCTRCIEACPAGAIVEPGIVDPDRCLQGLAEKPLLLDSGLMEKWGRRLYGCQDCQSTCPHNSALEASAPACPPEVGPSVSIRGLLAEGIAGVKGMFKGTPMGMGRISPVALVRNALIAAGNSGSPVLRDAIARYCDHTDGVLRETARWASRRLA